MCMLYIYIKSPKESREEGVWECGMVGDKTMFKEIMTNIYQS